MLAPVVAAAPPAKAPAMPGFVVKQPTVIAFFSVTPEDLKDPDTKESYSEFQRYVARAKTRLARHGIRVEQVYGRSFAVQAGTAKTQFTPVRRQCGYYFIAPGRKPAVGYGVITDDDLLNEAQQYFGRLAEEDPISDRDPASTGR
jgi:hypothetical protein